jgi:hypothetical protein
MHFTHGPLTRIRMPFYSEVMHTSSSSPINPETGSVYSRAELREAFEAVQHPDNWKLAIDAAIPEYMREVTREAVVFFAGCVPTFEPVNPKARKSFRRLRVRAVGYYAAVGA